MKAWEPINKDCVEIHVIKYDDDGAFYMDSMGHWQEIIETDDAKYGGPFWGFDLLKFPERRTMPALTIPTPLLQLSPELRVAVSRIRDTPGLGDIAEKKFEEAFDDLFRSWVARSQ